MTLGFSFSQPQLAEQLQSPLPLLARAVGDGARAAADGAGLQPPRPQLAVQLGSLLPLLACVTGAGASAEADDAGLQVLPAAAR